MYDFTIANLESPITLSTDKLKHQVINISSSPNNAYDILKTIDLVSLSNNHILDYKEAGVVDTINYLNKNKIGWFGVGQCEEDALKPYTYVKANQKIAIFGASRYANSDGCHWGTASDSSKSLFHKISRYKNDGYFVVVYFHWGYEYVRIPSPRERNIAHRCIDYGADFIVGAHSHIYQGIEQYHGRYIVYSLGNFIFHSSVYHLLSPLADNSPLTNSFAVGIRIIGVSEYELTIHGYETSDVGIRLYSDAENTSLQRKLDEISSIFKTGRACYLKEYYKQAHSISLQNSKVRNSFQKKGHLSIKEYFSLYSNANWQDIKNKFIGLIINPFMKNE